MSLTPDDIAIGRELTAELLDALDGNEAWESLDVDEQESIALIFAQVLGEAVGRAYVRGQFNPIKPN